MCAKIGFLIIFALYSSKPAMKNLFPRLSRITLSDWLGYHPYDKEVPSDHFYINLCNDIQHEMLLTDVNDNLVGVDYKCLSCMMICYFEDIISKTGLWTSFIDKHHELYGKYLPFFDMNEYQYGDINLADIQFLIWYFCSSLSVQNHFIDPFSIENKEIAQVVYSIIKEKSELAPKNENLIEALQLAPDADFKKVREYLDFFFFSFFLHQYYSTTLLEEEIINLKNQEESQDNINQLLNNRRNHLLFNRVSPLLAQRSNEILANWVGKSHPLYKNLLSVSRRKEGYFLYEGNTSTHFQMKHIASEIVVDIIISEWDFPLVAGETIVQMGIVQWGDEWYAIGTAFPCKDPKDLQITEREKALFVPVESHVGVVRREEDCFFEVNYNNRILFLESKRDAFSFIDTVWETYHLKYGMDSMDRKIFDVHEVTFGVEEDLDNLTLFFNPRSGMEFYTNIARCISVKDNPFFFPMSETNIEYLILDDRISSDFIFFLIENKMIEIEPISGKGGFHYVWSNCDFLLRFWKRERYISMPKLFIE